MQSKASARTGGNGLKRACIWPTWPGFTSKGSSSSWAHAHRRSPPTAAAQRPWQRRVPDWPLRVGLARRVREFGRRARADEHDDEIDGGHAPMPQSRAPGRRHAGEHGAKVVRVLAPRNVPA